MMNPYRSLPDHQFWSRAIARVEPHDVDPVIAPKFSITPTDQIATAGSCFAQHIARHLARSGFSYMVTEKAHPVLDAAVAERFGYGLFTARYGNVYTTRQMLQMLQRAFDRYQPKDDMWVREDGRILDPFRPQIQPDGFASVEEFRADRQRHFASIRRAVRDLDVLVFTLGLTEGWIHKEDGAAYPIVPGSAGGTFDDNQHAFLNLSVRDIIQDLDQIVAFVRRRNEKARFILTVSPVPLIATYEPRSVLVSTTYSKSALRVACEDVASRYDHVAYFPSYEIITGAYTRGRYFASDLRSVTEEGVSHVMRLFMKHYAGHDVAAETATTAEPATTPAARERRAERLARESGQGTPAPARERPAKAGNPSRERPNRDRPNRDRTDRARPDRARGGQHDRHFEDLEKVVAVMCDEEVLDKPDTQATGD